MNLDRVTSGKDIPDEINVIIEIPSHSDPVKYEIDKETGAMFVDRFMSSAMHYPCNYGYVPHTLSLDGDPVDVLVVTPVPLIAGSVIACSRAFRTSGSCQWPTTVFRRRFRRDTM